MKNVITEIKSTLEGINSRLDKVEGKVRDIEDNRKHPISTTKRKKESKNMRIV